MEKPISNRPRGSGSTSRPPDPKTFVAALCKGLCVEELVSVPVKKPSIHQGEPAIFFSAEEIEITSKQWKLCLVAKFLNGRPLLEEIRSYIRTAWCLKSDISVGLLDHRHVLLRFFNEEDFLGAWLKVHHQIKGHACKLFKWTPWFKPGFEPAIAPVWINLPHLPLNLFNESCLRSIAGIVGRVLKIDGPTKLCSRPSLARICVELDLKAPKPDRVWLGLGSNGGWQKILYEKLPQYCSCCCKQGHSLEFCRLKVNKDSSEGEIMMDFNPTKKMGISTKLWAIKGFPGDKLQSMQEKNQSVNTKDQRQPGSPSNAARNVTREQEEEQDNPKENPEKCELDQLNKEPQSAIKDQTCNYNFLHLENSSLHSDTLEDDHLQYSNVNENMDAQSMDVVVAKKETTGKSNIIFVENQKEQDHPVVELVVPASDVHNTETIVSQHAQESPHSKNVAVADVLAASECSKNDSQETKVALSELKRVSKEDIVVDDVPRNCRSSWTMFWRLNEKKGRACDN
ncbi:hypothetical protein HHK36_017660 [Tetracentron sinense]|uniref:DUF4283 domain-containing protein n=1 Tax=Tetracentron sinense TaxID=13715 RepID=A0A835D9M0_TETSI|nr:hypothetical protein HHK36_017660 [Tetracentron sinense]